MSDIVKAPETAVKRNPGQQPKWGPWVRKMEEVLNRDHPVGYAIVYNDEMLLAVVNSELPPEDRISKRTFNYYKKQGHIENETIASVFVATYEKALALQADNILRKMTEDVPGGWQKWAWIMERKFDEWNLRSKVVDETPDVARLVMRVKSDERLAEGDR